MLINYINSKINYINLKIYIKTNKNHIANAKILDFHQNFIGLAMRRAAAPKARQYRNARRA